MLPTTKEFEWEQIKHNIRRSSKGLVGSGHGYTMLHAFAAHGNDLAAKLLLDKGADVDARTNTHSHTPLIVAAYESCDTTVKLLLENGADIEAKAENKSTALIYAASSGRDD